MNFRAVGTGMRPSGRVLLLFAFSVGGVNGETFEQCRLGCETESGWCAFDPDPEVNCGPSLQGCYGRCDNATGGNRAQSFGAIAVSPSTMAWGYSYGFESQQRAEGTAIQYCREAKERPNDCKSVLWFYDTCGALAIAPQGKDGVNYWGSAWAESKRNAERQAMRYCTENGVKGCRVAVSVCSQ